MTSQNNKRRPILSCKSCRLRKSKCDRGIPCSNCRMRGNACIYEEGISFEALDIQNGLTTQSSKTTKIRSLSSSPRKSGTVEQAEFCPNDAQELANDAIRSLGDLTFLNGQCKYHGNKSAVAKHIRPELQILSAPVSRTGNEDQWFGITLERLNEFVDSILPVRGAVDLLFARYFIINPLITQLIRPQFQQEYETYWATRRASSHWIASLFGIICVSLRSYPNDDIPELVSIITSLGSSRVNLRRRLQDAIRYCLFLGGGLDNYDLDAVLALLLYQLNSDIISSSQLWFSNGCIVSMSQTLGLHRDPSMFPVSQIEAEWRRRLWMQVRLWDITNAWHEGLPTHINEFDTDTRFPTYDPLFDGEGESNVRRFQWMEAFNTIFLMWGRTHQNLFALIPPSYTIIKKLDEDANKAYEMASPWLHITSDQDLLISDPLILWQQITIEMAWNRALLSLHLPYTSSTSTHLSKRRALEASRRSVRTFLAFYRRRDELGLFRWFGQMWIFTTPLIGTLYLAVKLATDASRNPQAWQMVSDSLTALRGCPEFLNTPQASAAFETIEQIQTLREVSREITNALDAYGGFESINWNLLKKPS
ncbi:putative transcriptional regulatory protein [Neolecta irregularis DAH-3]|uniref:Putative transcriptional regulatory protein n=1 Tax=Neolecta irregularis (strain DAH-3) TaxID=1198029 RepID=A0A1U7LH86_NEOID|nr:putative transcriptional regulatory protein [Neolecta irregularis DAH-3]|eukprot:OLL22009.1 putative transcriptional regulatory protein [Neolecta irregularis DAH-3]